ncbi:uncharacterized protein METZ01_LOCUS476703, partial [marine metagenome]
MLMKTSSQLQFRLPYEYIYSYCLSTLRERAGWALDESYQCDDTNETVAVMKIYINREGKNSGPYSIGEVQGLIRKGEVHEDDMAWMEGMLDWTTVKAIIPDKPSVPLPDIPPPKTDRTSALVAVCAVLFLMIGAGVFVILTDPFGWLGEKKTPVASANSPAEKKSSSNGKGDNTPTAEATPPKYPLLPPKPPAKITLAQ